MVEKLVGYDFEMDTFISVLAPKGTDPDTLIEEALQRFMDVLIEGHAIVQFMGVYDE